MKVFVTGVAGQLGHDVMNELASRGYVGVGTDLAESYSGIQDGSYVTTAEYVSLDITNSEAVMNTIKAVNPDVVVHCAAWTAVDLAEDEDKQAKVKAINVDGTQNIADACKEVDAKRIFGIMGLAAKQGQTIVLKAEGDDEDAAIEKLGTFLKENL